MTASEILDRVVTRLAYVASGIVLGIALTVGRWTTVGVLLAIILVTLGVQMAVSGLRRNREDGAR